MAGLIDNTLDEIDSHLRNLRHQLAALEDARRQLVGDDRPAADSLNGRQGPSNRLDRDVG